MAFQEGIVPLRGTIGNITFTRGKGGKYEAQRKTSLTKERVQTDSAFVRTRENSNEFGTAAKGSGMVRSAVRLLLQNAKGHKGLHTRLLKLLMQVIKSDTTNQRGKRTIQDGDISKLKAFDFNLDASLKETLLKGVTKSMNRVTGELQVNVPSFTPVIDINAPQGTTHFAIVSGGYEIDFADGTSVLEETTSGILPWDTNVVAPITLKNTVTANSTKPLFLLLGVQFYEEVNGVKYPLKDARYNALNIVDTDQV